MTQKTVHLAVDMMSGDSGLRVTVPAALQALHDFPQLFLHLAGDQATLKSALEQWPESFSNRYTILHASTSVDMADKPSSVLRKAETSSMSVALNALACKDVSSVVSAGNTGALMVLSRKLVGMVPPTSRPAFCSTFPTDNRASLLLDLGANVDCSAEQLCTFAQLGSALSSSLYPVSSPSVALLSNGVEAGKGNAQVKRAADLLANMPALNYVGYIEANDLHSATADVVVCDGFVGNIALKAIEGTAKLARSRLAELVSAHTTDNISAQTRQTLLDAFSEAMDPEAHNGAFLLGLNGVVVKAHGDSSKDGFVASIGQALRCDEQDMIAKMKERLLSVGAEET